MGLYLIGQAMRAQAQDEGNEMTDEKALMEWISTAERMPESGQIVLAFHLNSHGLPRRIRAEYVQAMTREAGASGDIDCDLDCDYDEATDTFYWPGGWYEHIEHWDEYACFRVPDSIKVTHWMPLPEPPAEQGEAQG